MAVWKKIIVSGSNAHLNEITASSLTNDNILVAGVGGALESSGITYNGSELGLGSSIITSTGATSILSGSFSGSFQGDASGLTGLTTDGTLTDGNGIADFTFDGSTNATVSVQASGSSLNVDANGVGIAAGGVLTSHIGDNQVTAAKLDDVFTNGGGVAGSFGSSTQVPVVTIDGQGRITTASLAAISTTLDLAGDTGTDTLSLIDGTLTISGTANEIVTAVTDDQVTISLPDSVIIPTASIQQNLSVGGNLSVTGNLNVEGAYTYVNTANLYVEDKFILLNSGSANPDEGGIIIDEGGAAGHAFVYDSDAARFAFTGSLASDATSVTPDAFVAAVVDENSGHTDKAEYQKAGNIKVDTGGDIWIYV